jgi:hypothetical protein
MSAVIGHLRGVRAELRACWLPALLLAAVGALVAAGRTVQVYFDGRVRQNVSADWVSLGEPAGALRAAGWHTGSLLGVLFAAVVGALLFARPVAEGSWPLVRLGERRVGVLILRKVCAVVLLGAVAQFFIAVALWAACHVIVDVQPYAPGTHVALPEPESVTWNEAGQAAGRGLAALTAFGTLSCSAAAFLPGVFTTMASSGGSLLVTAPLVLTPQREWSPAYWIAAGAGLPDSAQWVAYFWSSAPSDVEPSRAWPYPTAVAVVALIAGWFGLRSERRLTPGE